MMRALTEAAPGTTPSVTCWDGVSEETLQAALALPATRCVEADLAEGCGGELTLTEPVLGRLGLVVTTRSAYRHSIVRTFVDAMECRTKLSKDLRVRLYSAAQEALMNAVLHGNLRIDAGLRGSLDGLAAAQDAIESGLNVPEIARSMIRIEAAWNASVLHVSIRDSGAGYDHGSPEGWCPPPDDNASGRGLAILQAFSDRVAVLNGGTTVKLEFRR
jgi:anti-sigma regulatory factor (Ser/Thr protein kinase)